MQTEWPSENIILGLLCERPMHGYELARLVQEDAALRAIWRIERSEVYFLLGKLSRSGLVVEQGAQQASGPKRVVFAPTEAGRAAFLRWLQTPEQRPRNLRTALLARVYMALRYDPHIAVELVEAQKQFLTDWLAQERQRRPQDEVVALVYRLRAAQAAAALEALDDLRALALARCAAPSANLSALPES